jgi:DNA repair exonuclease SbcCD nuclease subunit
VKFIHAADIHLDSPLIGLSAYADAPVEMLRTATRDAFTNLITEAIEQSVDFMVIAGDLYVIVKLSTHTQAIKIRANYYLLFNRGYS